MCCAVVAVAVLVAVLVAVAVAVAARGGSWEGATPTPAVLSPPATAQTPTIWPTFVLWRAG